MNDRRKKRRIGCDFALSLTPVSGTPTGTPGVMTECSSAGIGLLATLPVAVGDIVRIQVIDSRLGRNPILLGDAQVIQAAPTRAGSTSLRLGVELLAPDSEAAQRVYTAAQVQRMQAARQRPATTTAAKSARWF